MKHTLLLFILLAFSTIGVAQGIITDRPDQTESAIALEKGFFQIETGTFLELGAGERLWGINSTLFRYGIVKNLEARLVTEINRLSIDGFDKKAFGISDMELGIKWGIINKEKFQLGNITHLLIPNGTDGFSAEKVGVSNILSFSHPVTDNISFGYNVGFHYQGKNTETLTYTYAIGLGLTEKLGFYTEVYGSWDGFDSTSISYDGGFTYLLNENLQLDFSLGTGLNYRSNYFAMGVSWKFN